MLSSSSSLSSSSFKPCSPSSFTLFPDKKKECISATALPKRGLVEEKEGEEEEREEKEEEDGEEKEEAEEGGGLGGSVPDFPLL